jgi:membrane protein implicated in regulation of membrane protease activity
VLTILALVLAFLFLSAPWNAILVVGAALVDVSQTAFYLRWSQRRRAPAGAQALIGQAGVAVTPLSPQGQIRIQGELWQARSSAVVDVGALVVVRGAEGLVLDVEPE